MLSVSKIDLEFILVSHRMWVLIGREKSFQLWVLQTFQTEGQTFVFTSLLQCFQAGLEKCVFKTFTSDQPPLVGDASILKAVTENTICMRSLKMTGETPEVRSDKRKQQWQK